MTTTISEMYKDPFTESDPELIISKTKEDLGDPVLDRIRRIAFISLNRDGIEPSVEKGILRGIQLLYSLGLGFLFSHIFSFSDDEVQKLTLDNTSINGKPLNELLENKSAYRLMYKEYLRIYSKKSYYRDDLARLSFIDSVSPIDATELAKLLILIFVSSKFES
tara:strand:- start:153 stop:644 length:492 start_codon:yes stop_codon:yes gene_type:complete